MEKITLTSEFRNILFSVIRSGLEIETPDLQVSSDDYQKLLQIGVQQSLQPVMYYGMKRLGASKEILNEFDKARLQVTAQSIRHDECVRRISAAFDGAHIPYVLLKGAVLRNLYPSPEFRTSCDIDVLVHEEDIARAIDMIKAQIGFRDEKHLYHDVSMTDHNVRLELHFSIKEDMENIDHLLARAWEFAEPIGDNCRYAFTPEYQIFHVIAHMCYHLLHGGLGIRPFLDLWLLRHKTQYDEKLVCQMCSECGILKFYEECNRLCAIWLEKDEHTETTRLLEEFCLSGGASGSARFRSAARQRDKKGWRYIFSRAFPPASQVKERYRDESGMEHPIIYFYAKRLFVCIVKRRHELRKQLSGILSIDQDYLDRATELFKQLDL